MIETKKQSRASKATDRMVEYTQRVVAIGEGVTSKEIMNRMYNAGIPNSMMPRSSTQLGMKLRTRPKQFAMETKGRDSLWRRLE